MYSAFVEPALVKIPLPNHQWIEVKRELTYGEEEDMYANMRRQFGPNEVPVLDTTRIGRCRMEAFIVAWSFVDPGGRPVPVTRDAITQLRPSVARAIREALDKHQQAIEDAREEEKKDPDFVSA